MSSLVETFVSKASALQRQGRAGRVRSGFCFRLYLKHRYHCESWHSILIDIMFSAMKAKCHDIVPIANLLCSLLNCLTLRFDAFMDYSLPEILRVPLEELCLHIMVYNLDTYNVACYHKWKKYQRCSCCSLVEMSVRFSRGLSEPGLGSSSTSVSQ